MVSTETKIGMSLVKPRELKSQSWSEDSTRNHDSPIGDIKLHLPTMFFCGAPANEIDELLI